MEHSDSESAQVNTNNYPEAAARWPFNEDEKRDAFKWEDPRALDDPSLIDGISPIFMVDKKTGAVFDTRHPEFYFEPQSLDVTILLSSFRIICHMGKPRIVGVGEIDFESDLIGLISKPEAVSHPINVSVWPASEQATNSCASLGFSGEIKPDPWFPAGSKNEWFAEAYIEDDALLKTIQFIEKKPQKSVSVELNLNKGIYLRRRSKSSFADSFEDTYQVTNFLGHRFNSWANSPETAEGDGASISVASDTYVVNREVDCELQSELENPSQNLAPLAIDRVRNAIEKIGFYILALVGAVIGVSWMK